jgi:hypothetical protein
VIGRCRQPKRRFRGERPVNYEFPGAADFLVRRMKCREKDWQSRRVACLPIVFDLTWHER